MCAEGCAFGLSPLSRGTPTLGALPAMPGFLSNTSIYPTPVKNKCPIGRSMAPTSPASGPLPVMFAFVCIVCVLWRLPPKWFVTIGWLVCTGWVVPPGWVVLLGGLRPSGGEYPRAGPQSPSVVECWVCLFGRGCARYVYGYPVYREKLLGVACVCGGPERIACKAPRE